MSVRSIAVIAAASLLTAAGAALAGAPPSQGTVVDAVVVPGGPPPKIVDSYPAQGASVPAGTLVLKLTFDQPMTPDGWSYGQSEGVAFPHCLQKPRLLGDQRTFVLLCTVLPHQTYAIQINAPRDFASENGRSAKPAPLQFSTTEVGPRDIHDALKLAGLKDADDPIMTWHDNGAGVSQSAPPEPSDSPPR